MGEEEPELAEAPERKKKKKKRKKESDSEASEADKVADEDEVASGDEDDDDDKKKKKKKKKEKKKKKTKEIDPKMLKKLMKLQTMDKDQLKKLVKKSKKKKNKKKKEEEDSGSEREESSARHSRKESEERKKLSIPRSHSRENTASKIVRHLENRSEERTVRRQRTAERSPSVGSRASDRESPSPPPLKRKLPEVRNRSQSIEEVLRTDIKERLGGGKNVRERLGKRSGGREEDVIGSTDDERQVKRRGVNIQVRLDNRDAKESKHRLSSVVQKKLSDRGRRSRSRDRD